MGGMFGTGAVLAMTPLLWRQAYHFPSAERAHFLGLGAQRLDPSMWVGRVAKPNSSLDINTRFILNTFEQFLGRPSTSEEMEKTLAEWRVPILEPRNSEEVILSQVGHRLYEMFFKGYTRKQWRRDPRDLDASVCGRIRSASGRSGASGWSPPRCAAGRSSSSSKSDIEPLA